MSGAQGRHRLLIPTAPQGTGRWGRGSDRLTPDPRIVNRLDLPYRHQLLEQGVLGIDHDVSLDR